MADFAHGTVAIIGRDLNQQSYTAGAIAFKGDFFIAHAFKFAGAALDGPLDVVSRHVLSLGGSNSRAQARIAFRVATAALGGHGDFLDQTGKYLAALGVQRALFMLDCG